MTRQLTILFSLLLICHSVFANTDSNFQSFLNQWRAQNHITSVVVSIEQINTHQITTYTSGTMTNNDKHSVTAQTLYGVGSISKTFVSAALLQLQQEGKVSLDDPIGPYFPQYPRWKTITIRQLLNMTSGIPNFTEFPEFKKWEASSPTQKISPTQLIDIAYQHPDYFAPGTGWHYSNTDYFLAGLIIEKVTHQSLAQVYQQQFFRPLQLHHTFYSDHFYTTPIEQTMAHAYANGKDITHFNAGLPGAAGSMLMSSQDLLTWAQALFTPGKVLNQNSLQQFETTVKAPFQSPRPASSRYGLGVFSMIIPQIGKVWWYTGVIDGYSSIFMWIPSQHKIIVAQIASWPEDNFAVLFPNQMLIQKILKEL